MVWISQTGNGRFFTVNNKSLQNYYDGLLDDNKIKYDPHNLRYMLRIYGRLSPPEIDEMHLPEAIEYCERLLLDRKMMRPDTYLRPLAEQMPQMIEQIQLQQMQMIAEMQSTTRRPYKKQHMTKVSFPQDWV